VPFQIGRHVHPKAHAQAQAPATPTGIDYLHLIEERHTRSVGERLHYAQLSDPAPAADAAQPTEPAPDSHPMGAASADRRPPPDRDGLPYDADLLLTLPDTGDPTPGPIPPAPDPVLEVELAAFATIAHRGDTTDTTDTTDPAGLDDHPEENR